MSAVPVHPPDVTPTVGTHSSPLPSLLHTPLGLALIEIQGSLNIPNQSDDGSDQQRIGRLEFPLLETVDADSAKEGAWMKQVHFYVGERQRLVGEVKKLEKPIGILKKRRSSNAQVGGEELEIVDIVRWKLYFGSRPEFV